MGSVNKVILVGNLGADPELKYTPSSRPLCNLRIATTDVFKDKSGASVASSDAAVNKLAAGKATDFTATGTSTKSLADTGASCTVERVDARPSA